MDENKDLWKTAKGWLTDNERQLLHDIAGKIEKPFPSILNIGVEYGASMICFLQGKDDVSLFGIDLDISKWEYLTPNVQLIQCDTDTAFLWWARYVDVLFIDGDHSYDQTLRDLRYTQHLKKGGILAIHDCYSWEAPGKPHAIYPECGQAVTDFMASTRYTFEEHPYVDSIRWFTLHDKMKNKKVA